MLRVLLAVGLFALASEASAQDTIPPQTSKHSVYLEVYGPGRLMAINYDRLLAPFGNWNLYAWGGGMAIMNGFSWQHFLQYNVHLGTGVTYGTGKNRFEFGLGLGTSYSRDAHVFCLTPYLNHDGTTDRGEHRANSLLVRMGYRYQKPEGGLFLQALVIPLWVAHYELDEIQKSIRGTDAKPPFLKTSNGAELTASLGIGWSFPRQK